jgi:hypothetical protein
MRECVMPDDVLFRTKTGNVYHFLILIFSSLQSSSNATPLQNVRGKRAKKMERERERLQKSHVCKYLYINSLKNENKFLKRLYIEI